jgi:hypothetical protein
MSGEAVQYHEGEFIRIGYELSGKTAFFLTIEPYPQTYLRSGADHLLCDISDLIAVLKGSGVSDLAARPDRSATRTTLEEAGFRRVEEMDDEMIYAPDTPEPVPTLDDGRPGAFGLETPIHLEDGQMTPAAALYPGMRLADGGRVEEILNARLRRTCWLDGHQYGVLNRVLARSGTVMVGDMPGAHIEEKGEGTEMIWIVSDRSRVRSGTHLFEDMWGSALRRHERRITQAEVITSLNAEDRS